MLQKQPTNREVAEFMWELVQRHKRLDQSAAVGLIYKEFGTAFLTPDLRGIKPGVLTAFRRLTSKTVKQIGNFQNCYWRLAHEGEGGGRRASV